MDLSIPPRIGRVTPWIDGRAQPPLAEVAEIFDRYTARGAQASLGRQRLACHFFVEKEIGFDLRDVDGPAEADRSAGSHFSRADRSRAG